MEVGSAGLILDLEHVRAGDETREAFTRHRVGNVSN
jgi:hypothetical protein